MSFQTTVFHFSIQNKGHIFWKLWDMARKFSEGDIKILKYVGRDKLPGKRGKKLKRISLGFFFEEYAQIMGIYRLISHLKCSSQSGEGYYPPPFYLLLPSVDPFLPGEPGSPTYVGHFLGLGLGLMPLCPSTITLLNRKQELYNYQKRHECNKLKTQLTQNVLEIDTFNN